MLAPCWEMLVSFSYFPVQTGICFRRLAADGCGCGSTEKVKRHR